VFVVPFGADWVARELTRRHHSNKSSCSKSNTGAALFLDYSPCVLLSAGFSLSVRMLVDAIVEACDLSLIEAVYYTVATARVRDRTQFHEPQFWAIVIVIQSRHINVTPATLGRIPSSKLTVYCRICPRQQLPLLQMTPPTSPPYDKSTGSLFLI
jgi:hypothetical protein